MAKYGSWTPDTKNPLRLEARLKDKSGENEADCKSTTSRRSTKYNSKGQSNLLKRPSTKKQPGDSSCKSSSSLKKGGLTSPVKVLKVDLSQHVQFKSPVESKPEVETADSPPQLSLKFV